MSKFNKTLFATIFLACSITFAGPIERGYDLQEVSTRFVTGYIAELGTSVSIEIKNGKMDIYVDGNNCGVDDFGDTTFCTELAPMPYNNVSLVDATDEIEGFNNWQDRRRIYKFVSPDTPVDPAHRTSGQSAQEKARLIITPKDMKLRVTVEDEKHKFYPLRAKFNVSSRQQ